MDKKDFCLLQAKMQYKETFLTPWILKNISEGGLLRRSITFSILALQYIDIGISTQICHFYENSAVPPQKVNTCATQILML